MSKSSGFTLLESLVALLMLSGILLLLSGLIKHANKMEQAISGYHQLEWEVFLLQLDNELEEVNYLSSTSHEINGEVENAEGEIVAVTIKKNKQRIVKSQSNGFQPLLTGVNQFVCKENNHGVDFIVTFVDGKKKEGTWIFKEPRRSAVVRLIGYFFIQFFAAKFNNKLSSNS